MKCQKFIDKHLVGWKFVVLDKVLYEGRSCIALTNHTKKEIYWNRKYNPLPDWLIKDILIHEIAHALVGFGNSHNHKWKAVATRLGIRYLQHNKLAKQYLSFALRQAANAWEDC